MKEETKEITLVKKKEDDLDAGWESTKRKMKDTEDKVKILQERMVKLIEKYSNPVVVDFKCMNEDNEESKVEKKKILINKDNSDVTLAHADDKTIPAHKLGINPKSDFKCINKDKEESKVEKKMLINQDTSDVTLAHADDITVSAQELVLSRKPDIPDVTLVWEDEKILSHKVGLSINIHYNKEELQTISSGKDPDRNSFLRVLQSGEGSSEEFLQRPPPSPPYYFPPSPPHYEGSPGYQDYGQNYGGQVQDTKCYYNRGGQHYK
jgi:hypothetical protein